MGKGFQQTIIVGNLGRDPEMRFTQGGKTVTTFSVAVTTGSGDYEHTEWFKCQAWERLAEIVNEYAAKGTRVQCVGTLKTRSYEDKEGTTRYSTELTVRDFLLLSGRSDTTEDEPQPARRNRPTPVAAHEGEGDMPF
jgi:single-strand DNA-binding protein